MTWATSCCSSPRIGSRPIDVVHPTPIPDKGSVLTGLSTFWFQRTADIVANHMISVTDGVPDEAGAAAWWSAS